MTGPQAVEQLHGIQAADIAGLQRLAQAIATESGAAPRSVVHEWAAGSDDDPSKAVSVALQLEELMFDAALRESQSTSVELRVELLTGAVGALIGSRDRLLGQLAPLLAKRDSLPAGSVISQVDMRVCDAVYVLIRQLTALIDAPQLKLRSVEEYKGLRVDERDAEISRLRNSKLWPTMQLSAP